MATFSAKTWVDRISEYPTRRTLTKENGTSEIVTVARSEGTVSKEGDAFSAANMNNLETRIGKAITSVNTDIAALKNMSVMARHLSPRLSLIKARRQQRMHHFRQCQTM